MNMSRSASRFLVCIAAAGLLGAVLAAQTPPAQTFKPVSGQPGKDVVWVPTADILVAKMLDMANLTPQDYLIDLGSGDGRTVIAAAKRGATAMGIEYNPDMVELSKRNAQKENVTAKATFVQADLFKADIFESDFSKASVLTLFLLPELNLRLRPTILDMKPGTRIVSNSFKMEEWEPDDSAKVEGECASWCTAYLWIVPAKVEGVWRTPQGDLTLTQKFQMVTGTLGTAAIADGRLRGSTISFSANGIGYTGLVDGGAIKGTTANGSSWSATKR